MDSALVSVNGHTEFFKKGISTGLKSGSVAEGRVNILQVSGLGLVKQETPLGLEPARGSVNLQVHRYAIRFEFE